MRKHGILFKITKNRITKLALEGSKFKKLENLFSGPTAVAFSEDAIKSAKILTKFAKEQFKFKNYWRNHGRRSLFLQKMWKK